MRGLPARCPFPALLAAAACSLLGGAAAHGQHHKPWWSHYEGVDKFRKKVVGDVSDTWRNFKSSYMNSGCEKCAQQCKAKLNKMEKKAEDLERCQRKQKAAEDEAHQQKRQRRALERQASECEEEKTECHARLDQELRQDRARLANSRKELETEVRRQENMKLLVERDLDKERTAADQLRQQLQEANDARLLLGQRLAEELARDGGQAARQSSDRREPAAESAVAKMEALTQELGELTESIKRSHSSSQCNARPRVTAAAAEEEEFEAEESRRPTAAAADPRLLAADLARASQEVAELRAQLDAAKQKITGLELVMLLSPSGQEAAGAPSTRLACCVALTMLLGALCLVLANKVVGLEDNVRSKEKETLVAAAEADRLREELESECGEMLKVDGQTYDSGSAFAYHIFDEKAHDRTNRFVKVQCPGVRHCDVEVQILFNGCVLQIRRPASPGVEAATWRQPFQFRPSEGLFEFKEDQTMLEHGILQLVFCAYTHQSRTFRFPQHFDLAGMDFDGNWTLTPRECERQAELAPEVEDAAQDPPPSAPAPLDDLDLPQVCTEPSANDVSTTVTGLPSSEAFERSADKEEHLEEEGDQKMDDESMEKDGAQEHRAPTSDEDDSDEEDAGREMDVGQATALDELAREEATPLLAAAMGEEEDDDGEDEAAAAAADVDLSGALSGPGARAAGALAAAAASGGSAAGSSSLGAGSFERLELSRPRLEDERSEASSSSCASFEKVQADAY